MKVEDVQRILAKAIPNCEARKIISEYEMYGYGKPIPGKILETIAAAPLEKQPILAKAVVEEGLNQERLKRRRRPYCKGRH